MAHQHVEIDLGLGAKYEAMVPGRSTKSGYLGRAFVSMLDDVDLAAIEVHLANGDGSLCLFGSPDQLCEQLRQAADAVAVVGGALRSSGTGPVT